MLMRRRIFNCDFNSAIFRSIYSALSCSDWPVFSSAWPPFSSVSPVTPFEFLIQRMGVKRIGIEGHFAPDIHPEPHSYCKAKNKAQQYCLKLFHLFLQ